MFIIIIHRFGPYFVEPVVAGLDHKTGEPYISTMDLIGCPMETKDFVVGGTCSEQLYGMCESLWNPDMVKLWIFLCNTCALLYMYMSLNKGHTPMIHPKIHAES